MNVTSVRRRVRRALDRITTSIRHARLTPRVVRRRIEEEFPKGPAYQPDLDHPRTYNEKIQWLKLHWRDPALTRCSDKFAVRSFVEERVGPDVLVDLLGVWESAADVDFALLPEQFVLKVTNGSGANIICTDKSTADLEGYRGRLTQWMRPQNNHYFYSYEWQYKNVPSRIIAERYIASMDDGRLVDYKFHCFDGEPKLVMVCSERFSAGGLRIDYFSLDWQHLPFSTFYRNAEVEPTRPHGFDEMVRVARALSAGLAHVRVDLYEIDGKTMFGEMTFSSGNGMWKYEPEEWDARMGDMLRLPSGPELTGRAAP